MTGMIFIWNCTGREYLWEKSLTMKKLFICLTLSVVCYCKSFAQTPLELNSFISQTTSQNPATAYNTLYTVWKYDGTNVGSLGFTSNNGSMQVYNSIGDVNVHSQNGNVRLFAGGAERMRVAPGGNVGIGTTNPTAKLTVDGDIFGKKTLWLKTNAVNSTEIILEKPNLAYYSIASNNNAFFFYNHSTQKVFFRADQQDNIGIGTDSTYGHKLAVAGSILAEKVKVKLKTNWPDFVFDPAYKTPSIPELEAYIRAHKHLPGVPSAAEVAEKGIDVGDNQAALLEKIEQLTLIIIDQHKKIEAQEKRLQALEKKP